MSCTGPLGPPQDVPAARLPTQNLPSGASWIALTRLPAQARPRRGAAGARAGRSRRLCEPTLRETLLKLYNRHPR
ncbi:MAG: hypothetical protein MPJ22_00670 [Pirellulales bacterium]|nr:hypothetical protein [Pirellulales bacterium]